MRAVVMRNKSRVVDSLPDPQPGPGQVLVKTLACGICGSDLHALRYADRVAEMSRRGNAPMRIDLNRDVVMGHEFCAEVLDYGEGTARTNKPGTRVCAVPIVLSGNGVETIGYSNEFPGGYGEKMVLSEMLLFEVPDTVGSDHAALTEPLAVGMHAVEQARLTGGEVPLVIGCGPVGLAIIAALKLKGAGPVVAADFSRKRRTLAEGLGADIVIDPSRSSPYTRWHEVAAPEGYDPHNPMTLLGVGPQLAPCVVFECVGVPGMIQHIIEGAPRHARVVVAGACMEADQIEPLFAVTKEINIQFVYGYSPEEFAGALRHIAEGKVDVSPLITGKVGLSGVAGAFDDLCDPDRHAKILIEPWRD